MAEVTLQVGGTFPAGTKVEAYPRTGLEFRRQGKPHATAKVGKDTTVTLKGLVDNGPYWIVGEVDGETRRVQTIAHDAETRSLPAEVAVTQAATRRVAEKVAEGTAAVRAGSAALALEEPSSPPQRHDGTKAREVVVGARSVSESRPRRSTRRGADSPRARKTSRRSSSSKRSSSKKK